jgi:toxin ParE1/3/4
VKSIWSPLAIVRVAEIAAWIAAERPHASNSLVEELFAAVERLVLFPESGREVPEIQRPEIREVVHKRHRIIYKTNPETIEILTVRHSRQELEEEDLVQRFRA